MSDQTTTCADSPASAPIQEVRDPLEVFLADPDSHLSDILYIYFRIYKKKVLRKFIQEIIARRGFDSRECFCLADVGASTGFDVLYLLRMLSANFKKPLPFDRISLSLIEGDAEAVAGGKRLLQSTLPPDRVDFCYHDYPLVEGLPLPDESQHVAICSEVVEHLEAPEKLFREIFRILKPGGYLILTTDNSPSFFQRIRRIPALLAGRYRQTYARPSKESTFVKTTTWGGREYPIYGHINLNPTRFWERLSTQAGFTVENYATYESIRRGGGSKSSLALAFYFTAGALVYYLLPRRIGRFFGDTTALLLGKPSR